MLRLLRLNSHMGSERVLTIQLDNQTQTTTTTTTTTTISRTGIVVLPLIFTKNNYFRVKGSQQLSATTVLP